MAERGEMADHGDATAGATAVAPQSQIDETAAASAPRRRSGAARIALGAAQAVVAVGLIAGAVAGAQWLVATQPTIAGGEATEPTYTVEAIRAEVSAFRPSFAVFGAVAAARNVEMRALVAGEVADVNAALVVGAFLPEDAALIEIDRFAYEGAVIEAEANLAEARAQLVEAKARLSNEQTALARAQEQLTIGERDLRRSEDLEARGAGSEATVDDRRFMVSQRAQTAEAAASALITREAEIDRLEASLMRLEWRLSQAQRDLRDTVLRAPFDAIVRSENVEVGRRLSDNDVVAELYAAGSLDVRFTVSDRQFGRLRDDEGGVLGREVLVSWAIGDAPVTARAIVDRVGSDVLADRGGVELIARIVEEAGVPDAALAAGGADQRLKPGAVVSVEVPDRAYEAAARLPETALFNGDHVYLLRQAEDGATRLVRQAVEALAWQGDAVIIRGAPPESLQGALVMTTRLAEAGDGVRVRRAEPTADDAAPRDAAALN